MMRDKVINELNLFLIVEVLITYQIPKWTQYLVH